MNISLPVELRDWVQAQVRDRGFGTASEFLRDVLRRERLAAARRKVEARLLEAIKSPAEPMAVDEWDDIERQARRRVATRAKAKTKKRS